jgi:hypothetical protein
MIESVVRWHRRRSQIQPFFYLKDD